MFQNEFYIKQRWFLQKRFLRNLVISIFSISVFSGGVLVIWVSTLDIPSINSFDERKVTQSTKIFDKTGDVLLFDVYQNIRRTIVPFNDISQHVKNATIAIEDPDFYSHHGVKPSAVVRAMLVNVQNMSFVQGGSTITQQVIKNSLLTPEKTITRKLKEWLLAVKLEQIRTKDEILNIYLNEIPYGGDLYGIEEASQEYLGVSADELTITQSAYLAALPKAPTSLINNPEHLTNRKNKVLIKMLDNGFISRQEYIKARNTNFELQTQKDNAIRAPHFVMYVRDILNNMFGEDVVRKGGLRVYTTLDYKLQKKSQEIVHKNALKNTESFNARNAATTAIDPRDGGIRVMVGSRDFFDENINGQFNVATSPNRQPGSTFKPFAYAAAFKRGYTPETIVFDTKTQFSTACNPSDFSNTDPCYAPGNYDDTFRGPVTFRDALAQSINIPAIKVLYLAGLEETLALAQDMGVNRLGNIRQYGLTLVLGGGEVSLLDMTGAYSVFANKGIKNTIHAIKEVRASDGEILYEHEQVSEQVLDPEVTFQISDILSDNTARSPAFGYNSDLHFPDQDVAVKTGTTNDYRDAWIVGYTPRIAVGAWAGNNDNSSMVKRVAGFVVAPMWREIMNEAVNTSLKDEGFEKPISYKNKDIKPILKGEWKHSNGVHSILHWVNKKNPQGPIPSVPARDTQYPRWEYGVQQWLQNT